MIVRSKILELDKCLFEQEVLDVYIPENPVVEYRTAIDSDHVHMENFQLATSGMFILQAKMNFSKPVHFQTEIVGDAVMSQFIFYGPCSKINPREVSRHNIRFIPSFNSTLEIQHGIDYQFFIAVLSKEYFLRLVKRDSLLLQEFIEQLNLGHQTSYMQKDCTATFEMQQTIAELVESKKIGEIRRLHLESCILALLMYQFEQYLQFRSDADLSFSEEDISRLEQARIILENRIANPPTQRELASELLTSESKLRKDFRRYYSMTINNYLMQVRMKKAKSYLLDERLPIYEVAALTGYSHQNNFTNAFKRYYGVPPIALKN